MDICHNIKIAENYILYFYFKLIALNYNFCILQ